jgi:hypothetical protein
MEKILFLKKKHKSVDIAKIEMYYKNINIAKIEIRKEGHNENTQLGIYKTAKNNF